MKKSTTENSESNQLLIIALVIVLLIIAFAVSGGLLKFSKRDIEAEIEKQKKDLHERKRIVDEKLKNREAKRDNLNKLFSKVYFIARLLIVVAWLLINGLLLITGVVSLSIETFVALNGFFLIVLLVVFYLFKGVHTLNDVISLTKTFFEDIVFSKHKNIHQEIMMYKEESLKLEAEIIELERRID